MTRFGPCISLTLPSSQAKLEGFVKAANRRNITEFTGPTDLLFDLGQAVAGDAIVGVRVL
jgi:hypothetical protein